MTSILQRGILLSLLFWLPTTAGAGEGGSSCSRYGSMWETIPTRHWRWLDRDWGAALVMGTYRSYGSLFVDLDREEDFTIWQEDEIHLYRDLLHRSLRPGYFLLELTEYPLAAFSAWLERDESDVYHAFNVGKEFNLIRSLGAGYQEPWSVSVFLGQLAAFWNLSDEDELVVAATGAAGLVVTTGLQQLFDNAVVEGGWFRIEWKLKGEGSEGPKQRFWDLKGGYRWYGIPEVSNTLSLTLQRERTDRGSKDWRLLNNSTTALELQMPISEPGDGFSRVLFEYGKFFPLRKRLVGLKVGYLYENRRKYVVETQSFGAVKQKFWELFVQPVVVF
ncbi:MAG: hypothetical protein ACETWG_00215 [Candidatus Neomarinimicrobiota bacterium]